MIVMKSNLIKKRLIEEILNSKEKFVFNLIFDSSIPEVVSYINMIKKQLIKLEWSFIEFDVTLMSKEEIKSTLIQDATHKTVIARPIKDESFFTSFIDSSSDIDMLTLTNMGKLYAGDLKYLPATAKSVSILLEEYQIPLAGKNALVIGRSQSVGMPIFMYLQKKNCTCTLAHSRTPKNELDQFIQKADIIVLCSGHQVVDRNLLNNKQVIIDCGFNENGEGDLGFVPNEDEVYAYTPVPGGVGPLTIISLCLNSILLK